MSLFPRNVRRECVLASLCASSATSAIALDSPSAAWANGVLSDAYDIDPAYAGDDVVTLPHGSTFANPTYQHIHIREISVTLSL